MRNRYRYLLSHVVMTLCGLSVLVALVPLALVLFYVLSQGLTSLNWAFISDMPKPPGEVGGGMANAIVGSLIMFSILAKSGFFLVGSQIMSTTLCVARMPLLK